MIYTIFFENFRRDPRRLPKARFELSFWIEEHFEIETDCQNPRNPYLGLSLPGELYFGGVCRHVGRSAGRSAGRPAGRPGGACVVSGAEKKII